MNDNETFTYDNKEYVSPTVSRDEQMNFIDTLRQTSQDNINRINQDTQNLGSQVDPAYGGFSQGTQFENRYVTPQTNAIVANLKATAQQTALNQALTNLQNQWSQKYSDAYRDAKIREYNTSSSGSGSSSSSSSSEDDNSDDISTVSLDEDTPVSVDDTSINIPTDTSSSAVDTNTNLSQDLGLSDALSPSGYGNYYVDANGNITGVRIYSDNTGAETATQSYTASGWRDFVKNLKSSGGKLYNANGVEITGDYL